MSILKKLWKLKNTDPHSSILQKLLANRGLRTDSEIEHFFHPSSERDFHDPFLMKDMERAVERIGRAIEKSERIMIFGDYDVDGITATAILMRCLRKLGANVSYRLPHRIEDGYGLREKFIHEFARLGVKITITVDNGISCFHEVEVANAAGIDVIITDHHTIPEKIPNAFAILHPKLPGSGYPFAELTGAGVALKLAQALYIKRLDSRTAVSAGGLRTAEPRGRSEIGSCGPQLSKAELTNQEIKKLLDLACMGTIGDLGPLIGENRYIVKEGLSVLEHTRWPGLSRLKQSAGVNGKIDTWTVGFLLGPRLNAAGRVSHPSHALRLLLHDAEYSGMLAQNLEKLNKKRQQMMEELMEIADEMAVKQCSDSAIIISHPDFHGGVIGLIASKLVEKYFRPAIVMEDRGDTLVGSCRSVDGVNIVEILKNAASDFLAHFGGHAMAAGFDLPKIHLPNFAERVKMHIGKLRRMEACQPVLPIECEISPSDVSQKTVEMLEWFKPFGVGNEVPRFLLRNLALLEYRTVGAENKHLKTSSRVNGMMIDGIGFRLGQFAPELNGKKSLDVVCEIEENEWNGSKNLQLKLVDFR